MYNPYSLPLKSVGLTQQGHNLPLPANNNQSISSNSHAPPSSNHSLAFNGSMMVPNSNTHGGPIPTGQMFTLPNGGMSRYGSMYGEPQGYPGMQSVMPQMSKLAPAAPGMSMGIGVPSGVNMMPHQPIQTGVKVLTTFASRSLPPGQLLYSQSLTLAVQFYDSPI